jgi:MFS family permease
MSPTPTRSLGPIRLAPGVSPGHVLCYLFAAFVSIGLFTYFTALTPYLLKVNLGLPQSEHGRVSGDLQFWQEIVLLATIGLWGALSDRVGRRGVYVAAFVVIAAGYGLYAFAGTTGELLVYRMVIGTGIAGAAAMLSTIIADYPADDSRGKLTGIAFFLNGIGSVLFFVGLTKLPQFFEASGATEVAAGRYSFLAVAGIALLAGLVMLGLKRGRPDATAARTPLLKLMAEGVTAAAKAPRIALCYGSAFAARADMAIITLFITLWVSQVVAESGMSAPQAAAKAGQVVGIIQGAALLWSPVFGFLADRMNRITVLIVGFLVAGVGYGWVAMIDDPTALAAIPALLMLGVGQGSAILASTLLLSQEAPVHIRGSVFGLQSFCGALGILAISAGGGRLFDTVGPHAPFSVVAVANGLVFVWAVALRAVERRQAATAPA